jgi:hypothetical protein
MAGRKTSGRRQPHDLLQAAPHAIALDGLSDLPRNGEADAYRTTVSSLTRLQYESRGRHFRSGRGSQEIAPSS